MPFDPTLAAIRFGFGLSPSVAPPASVDDMLGMLAGPDVIAQTVPIARYSDARPSLKDLRDVNRVVRDAREGDSAAQEAAEELRASTFGAVHETGFAMIAATLARAAHTPDGFRERLTHFWADHFTIRATHGNHRHLLSSYVEEAIRPYVNAKFGDMLVAVATSPLMLLYLDQHQSWGPNSPAAEGRQRGMNENFAREMLELHTLGVDGSYTQTDVRELAELLTGVTTNPERGMFFHADRAEPGPETLLGVAYGGDVESLDHVIEALHALAVHPDTARHLAHKMAVHFVAPEPDAALVDAMAARFIETGGDLSAMNEAMLRSDAAWVPERQKVKLPFEFIASSMRALDVPLPLFQNATVREVRNIAQQPLAVMGQAWQTPLGPDGWSEDENAWITAQGMAGRITWAMTFPAQLLDELPDPREFVMTALGPTPADEVVFAAGAAATEIDGIGIVLASAAFQRR